MQQQKSNDDSGGMKYVIGGVPFTLQFFSDIKRPKLIFPDTEGGRYIHLLISNALSDEYQSRGLLLNNIPTPGLNTWRYDLDPTQWDHKAVRKSDGTIGAMEDTRPVLSIGDIDRVMSDLAAEIVGKSALQSLIAEWSQENLASAKTR